MNTIHLVPVEGRVPYRLGLEWQRRLARDKIEGRSAADVVLLLEHAPAVTLGRGSRPAHVTASAARLAAEGIDVVEIERGGDVTYHGPGQLVGYPLLDLGRYRRDLHWYLRALEHVLIDGLGRLGLRAFGLDGYTGVWVGDPTARSAAGRAAGAIRKIASIGVHVSRWVTWHGFALNVTREPLRGFELIVPCGIDAVRMTSLETEGCAPPPETLRAALAEAFAEAFDAGVEVAPAVAPGAPLRLEGRATGVAEATRR